MPCGVWAVRACGARERARAGAGDTGDTYLKQHDAPEDREYLCDPPMMAKTVLDLLQRLGVDDADIRFDKSEDKGCLIIRDVCFTTCVFVFLPPS